MKSFTEYREAYAGLYQAVQKLHSTSVQKNQGHGMDHDVTVAQLAAYIAPNEELAGKGWCAGMLHSIDRLTYNTSDTASLTRACTESLAAIFSEQDIEEIIEAAVRHAELNQDDQSLTQQVLMDADRLANLNAALPMRSGQFHPHIPALELEYMDRPNPVSTYSAPKSVLDNLRLNITEYLPQMRLPKAKELAEQYVERLQQMISWIGEEYTQIGL